MKARRRSTRTTTAVPAKPDLGNKKVHAILDAARRLFLEQELAAPSMDLIADTAGVSKATIYVYFPSRDKLLLALIEQVAQSTGPGVVWETGAEPTNVEEDLRGIARRLMTFFLGLRQRNHAFFRLLEQEARNLPELGRAFFAAGPEKTRGQLASFLKAASAKGLLTIPDIELAVIQFTSLVQGDLHMRHKLMMPYPSKKEQEAFIEGSIRLFLAAYGGGEKQRRR